MDEETFNRLKEEVQAWAAETRLFIAACHRLIEYFGSEQELTSWNAAVSMPLEWVDIVVAQVPRLDEDVEFLMSYKQGVAFCCAEHTAGIISPLAEVVGGPVAEFVYSVRELLPTPEQSRNVLPYARFVVSFAEAVTGPLWKTYRHLAPEEWRKLFPEEAK